MKTFLAPLALVLSTASAEAFAPHRMVSPGGAVSTMRPPVWKRMVPSLDLEPSKPIVKDNVLEPAALVEETKEEVVEVLEEKGNWLQSIDGIVYCSYLCNVMALSLPVLLVPIAATEQVGSAAATMKIASSVAGIMSIATLGGATGKFTNGFICQAYGSYACSKLYFAGLAACSLLFSMSSSANTMGLAYAGMEFFASIQWAALAVMLSNFYEKSPLKLAAALTALGLSSTSGQIAAKTLGMTLAGSFHWRTVARIGAATALLGGLMISRAPKPEIAPQSEVKFSFKSIQASLKALFGTPLFWMLAMAHSMSFVARGTDRILGTFFQHMVTDIPQAVSGGLTLSITLGLVHGLVTGSKEFTAQPDTASKKRFLAKRYLVSVMATLGLAALSHFGRAAISSKVLLTAAVGLLSGTMASNIAFQYFQFPAMIAKSKFKEHKAIVISFLDGFGFLLSAPIFAATSRLVPALGWSSAWVMLAGLFAAAAVLMMRSISPILETSTD